VAVEGCDAEPTYAIEHVLIRLLTSEERYSLTIVSIAFCVCSYRSRSRHFSLTA
jgi:hypothetical protein